MARKRNDNDPRDSSFTARVYATDKEKAFQRALENGDNLGYLVACFVAGYGAGYELPTWFSDIDLKSDPLSRFSRLGADAVETDG